MNRESPCSWADEDQQRVARALEETGRVMVEAPPGTGKTFTALYLATLAARKGEATRHRPSIILTFSNNARTQLEQEREAFLKHGWMTRPDAATIRIENYHAFYLDILRKRRGAWGCTSVLRPATERERNERVTRALKQAPQEEIETARNRSLLTPPAELTLHQQEHLRAEAAQGLTEGRPHYDDFAPLVRHLLTCSPRLVEWLQTFPLVIIDEFQDTDEEQCTILKLWNPKRLAIFFDRYQMIYAFRGADPQRPAAIAKFFGINKTLSLSKLHRANEHASLQAFIVSVRADDLGGRQVVECDRPWLRIIESPDQPRKQEQRSVYELRYNAKIGHEESTGILTRTNPFARVLQQALLAPPATRSGPYFSCALVGGPHAADERLRDAIYDLRRITAAGPLREWTGALLDEVNVKPYQRSKKPVCFRTEFARSQPFRRATGVFSTIRDELAEWQPVPGDPATISTALELILRWATLLAARRYADPDRRFYLRRMIAATANTPSWETACDALETALLTGKHFRRMREHGVTICTVHQSKGREFDHVIIPWIGWPEGYDEHRMEDRRLLYVALTRAKRRVTIIIPAERQPRLLAEWHLCGWKDHSSPEGHFPETPKH